MTLGRTYAPQSIKDLGSYWVSQGGVNLGIVGNAKHCVGYHLGEARIYGPCACSPSGTCKPGKRGADYSVQRARDRGGLTDAASAIDLGRLDGSLENLQAFSRWLVERAQAGHTPDIREIIYSPDGVHVQRWESSTNSILTGEGQGDDSHLLHTHISFYRDSEGRDKVAYFAPYFEEAAMIGLEIVDQVPASGVVRFTEDGHAYVQTADRQYFFLAAAVSEKPVVGKGRLAHPLDSNPGDRSTVWIIGGQGIQQAIALDVDVDSSDATTGLKDVKHNVSLVVDGTVVAEVPV